jgi:hypothetical protein
VLGVGKGIGSTIVGAGLPIVTEVLDMVQKVAIPKSKISKL